MAISNDQELTETIHKASTLIQEIQDYVQRDFSKEAKIRFPRGHIRTADEARGRLSFLNDSNLKSNIAYTIMLSDVQHWISERTDLFGLPSSMVTKLQIFLLGVIVESITRDYLRGICGNGFKRRTQYLVDSNIISNDLKDELDWIWDLRNRMHLFQLDNREWDSKEYTIRNHNRAVRAFRQLLDALNQSG